MASKYFETHHVFSRTNREMIQRLVTKIAVECNFEFPCDWSASKDERIGNAMETFRSLKPEHKEKIVSTFYWVHTITETPKVMPTLFHMIKDAGVEVTNSMRRAHRADLAAFAYCTLDQKAWRQLCTMTRLQQIHKRDWFVAKVDVPDGIVPATDDETLKTIKDALCERIFSLEGRGEHGFCSHVYHPELKMHCFHIDLTDHPFHKKFFVKGSKFNERVFKDTYEDIYCYHEDTHEMSVCADADSDERIDRCAIVAKTIFSGAANVAKKAKPVFNLSYLKFHTAVIPVPTGSHITGAKIVSATASRKGIPGTTTRWDRKVSQFDLHDVIVGSLKFEGIDISELVFRQLDIMFDYTDAYNAPQTFCCHLSKNNATYLDADPFIQDDIRALLKEAGILIAA